MFLPGMAGARAARKRSPNIVLILVDDLGYGDLGCYGSTIHETPHIDALAASGMRFTDFHSNCPLCTPTRIALLTGHYQQRYGIETALGFAHDEGLPLDAVTLGDSLHSAGYTTASFGKWHVGYIPELGPQLQGFDQSCGSNNSSDYFSHVSRVGELDWYREGKLSEEPGYLTEIVTDSSVEFIESNRDRPFFLYLPHAAVHFPWQGPGDEGYRTLGKIWHDVKYGLREDRKQAYKEMVEAVDASVGRVMSTLKRLGLEEDTFVFLTSDNGGHELVANNAPLSGFKGNLREGGHRVPAMARWPGVIEAGGVSHETAMTMDLLPTLRSVAGCRDRSEVDGIDLWPHVQNGTALPKRTLFWRFKNMRAVRRGPWKYFVEGDQEMLFNLEDDLEETTDLASTHPGLTAELKEAYAQWEADVDRVAVG
jgi:arylsulfatase A-like enzyme